MPESSAQRLDGSRSTLGRQADSAGRKLEASQRLFNRVFNAECDLVRSTREQVLAFRLSGHSLDARRPLDALLDVAGACGVRNTPPGSAALAFQARVADLTPEALDQALDVDRTLIEVLGMRISPYIVPARDTATFTLGALPQDEASLRAVLVNHAAGIEAGGFSLTEALDLAAEAARGVLAEGPLTRGALSGAMTQALPDALGAWCEPCKVHHVAESLFRLVGVRGEYVLSRGEKAAMYVRTDQWLGKALEVDQSVARLELLRRYFRCFGPLSSRDFAAWVGMSVTAAQRSWDQLGDRLTEVELDGRRGWIHADDVASFENPPEPGGVRLLPPYDAYLDLRDRLTLIPDKTLHKRIWRAIGNPGVVLEDGEVVGTWRPQKKGRRLVVNVEGFTGLSPDARAGIEAEAALLAPFRGCTSVEIAFAD